MDMRLSTKRDLRYLLIKNRSPHTRHGKSINLFTKLHISIFIKYREQAFCIYKRIKWYERHEADALIMKHRQLWQILHRYNAKRNRQTRKHQTISFSRKKWSFRPLFLSHFIVNRSEFLMRYIKGSRWPDGYDGAIFIHKRVISSEHRRAWHIDCLPQNVINVPGVHRDYKIWARYQWRIYISEDEVSATQIMLDKGELSGGVNR